MVCFHRFGIPCAMMTPVVEELPGDDYLYPASVKTSVQGANHRDRTL